ncbi:MAG: FtsX-like permease family protein [Gammaproteobacteria bacterium]
MKLALHLARRELAYSRRTFTALFLAITIGVAALTAITSFAERIELAMAARSGELLGGDLRVSSRRDLQPFIDALPANLVPDATVLEMPSMASTGDRLQLVEVKVVGGSYPLLGELLIKGQGSQKQPEAGSVWVDASLMTQLQLEVGDSIELGFSQLTVAGVIEHEPDRVAGAFSMGPRVILARADLTATRLLQPGSRFRTRLLYTGSASEIAAVERQLDRMLPEGAQLENAREGLETTREMTRQASRYLRLTAFAGLLLAMVAVFLSVSGLMEQRVTAVATLKALGASSRLVLQSYLLLLVLTALIAGGVGVAAGMSMQNLLPRLLGDLLPTDLPAPGNQAIWQGMVVAAAITLLSALPPLWRLVRTPPVRVLRSATPPPASLLGKLSQAVAGIITATLLLVWLAQDLTLGLQAMAALLLLWLLFALVGQASLFLLHRVTGGLGLVWRQAITGLIRHRTHTLFALAALATGVLALLAPSLVQQDLLRQWMVKVPSNSPNHFLIGIQPDQVTSVEERLAQLGASQFSAQPMIRARLVSIDGLAAKDLVLTERRARRMADRENNLSWRRSPEPHNPILEGQWWSPDTGRQEISVEQEWAELLGATLGSHLVFEVSGDQVEGVVTSIRRVDWERLTTNFFVIFSPGALDEAPTSYVTAFRTEPDQGDELRQALVSEFPNLTVIDMREMLAAMQSIISRLASAVQFMGALTLLAGCAVLLAVVVAERGRVSQEAALLRALGASKQQINTIFTLRFGLLGLVAALSGIVAAVASGGLLATRMLQIAYQPSVALLVATLIISALLVTLVGRTGSRRALTASPLTLFRENS